MRHHIINEIHAGFSADFIGFNSVRKLFYMGTEGNLVISVWGINFAACILIKKSGMEAN